MEKYAKKIRTNFTRLLICLLFVDLFPAVAKPISWNYLWSLRFKPVEETLFTETENAFSVEIENVTPDSIQIAVNSLPKNVSFVSSKKENVIIQKSQEQGGGFTSGTKITIFMKFAKTGYYRIGPIDLVINSGFYQIPFEPIEIFENPRFISPELSVTFNNLNNIKNDKKFYEVEEGQHVIFTVNARYVANIENIDWDIPKDSIFKKLRDFDLTSEKDSLAQEFKPIATFDWQPLKQGNTSLPQIFITASSFNGSILDLECPSFQFKILELQKERKEQKTKSPFAYAFIEATEEKNAKPKIVPKSQDVLNLIDLHKKERKSLPLVNSVTKERRNAELQMNLTPSSIEPSVPFFVIIFTISFLLLLLSILLLVFKHKSGFIYISLLFVLISSCAFIYGVKVFSLRGIFIGGQMRPIPEKAAPLGVHIQAGSVVYIIKTAENWMYIRYNDTLGWVPAENVYLIK